MKTIKLKKYILLMVVLVIISSFEIKSQVKVTNNGYVGIGMGTTTPNCHFQVGNNDTYNSRRTSLGAELRICRYNSSWDMGIFKARDNTSTVIGLRFRPQDNRNIVNAMHKYSDGDIVYYQRLIQSSDIRLTENIRNVQKNEIDSLYKLSAIEYNLKPCDTIEVASHELTATKKIMYGFIAQEMKEILPDFVYDNGSDYLSINYISLIPLLVEALKEQQKQIEDLKDKIDKDKNTGSGKNNTAPAKNNSNSPLPDDIINSIKLYQNRPNPFNDKTLINAYIPVEVNSAVLYIYDMQGVQIKNINIQNRGNIEEFVNGYELKPGMYLYTLITDNYVIDTKTMILTD